MKLRAIAYWVAVLGVLLLMSACGNGNAGSSTADDAHQAAGHEQTDPPADPLASESVSQEQSTDGDPPADPQPAKNDPADSADKGQPVDPQQPASSVEGGADHKGDDNHTKPIEDEKSSKDQGSGKSEPKPDSTGKPAGSAAKNDDPKPEPEAPAPSKAGGSGNAAKPSPPAEPSKDGSKNGSAGGGKTGDASAKTDKQKSKTHVVEITDFAFSPASLEITSGDRITFVNKDPVSHTATADDDSFDTDLFGKDEEKTVLFEQVGEFGYYCAPHPAMRGTIIVKAK
ncbi:plastocyanin/azurin family copper-binding protein [Paenibacillus mendelii]|uniref:Plastocyanin/azurin family copper-binding protein n=1 Tax=Paenibacillus mendelii TaxID=206163 RepID=A0ABV6J8E1_9BACL|nr:plastocyanin/azurin family copper-binding protein [Paenibacillus mendelii]MCQ6559489.1 cupredoxin domain-containing protein [Paenibacillus mendelii]